MKYLKFLLLLFIITSTSFPKTINESTKSFIYEIVSPNLGGGTGFAVTDSLLGPFLITCKHVVQDSIGNYIDSVFVRRNKMLPTGQIVSDTSAFILRLKVKGHSLFVEHPNPDVDLIMIPLSSLNTTISSNESLPRLYSRFVLSKDQIAELGLDEGTTIELIGFALSPALSPNTTHYHFSRFGKIGLYTTNEFTLLINKKFKTANYILLDMIIRPGDSGSPIFAHIDSNVYLIGFVAGYSPKREYGIAYPVYYLHDLMKAVRDTLSILLKQEKGK